MEGVRNMTVITGKNQGQTKGWPRLWRLGGSAVPLVGAVKPLLGLVNKRNVEGRWRTIGEVWLVAGDL